MTSNLLHITFYLFDSEWKDSTFKAGKFYYVQVYGFLKKYGEYTGSNEIVDELKTMLDRIDDESFQEATKEFRGRCTHMIPPNIEFGLSGLVNRMEDKAGKISYGLGGQKPLLFRDLLPHLIDQHQKFKDSFGAFWSLFKDILEHWEREKPNI